MSFAIVKNKAIHQTLQLGKLIESRMQQLSLPLNLPQSGKVVWFQEMLQALGVSRSAGWADRFGLSLGRWLAQQGHSPIKTLSLFSGGGGLDIGFHDAGFDIVQMVELEAKYVQTL